MEPKPGTYVVVLRNRLSLSLQIGRRGELAVRPGFYLYVGSALGSGGLVARVSRHCRGGTRKHWHIDYLRARTQPVAVWYRYSRTRLEHDWAAVLARTSDMVPVKGFGCSDCQCDAHLFYSAQEPTAGAFAEALACHVSVLTCASMDRSGVLPSQT
jgi:Uri superfamily endonuclease